MTPSGKSADPAPMPDFDELLARHDGVLDTSTAPRFMTYEELLWRILSGRWQKPARGVVVAHSGPLTAGQIVQVALTWAGPRASAGAIDAAAAASALMRAFFVRWPSRRDDMNVSHPEQG